MKLRQRDMSRVGLSVFCGALHLGLATAGILISTGHMEELGDIILLPVLSYLIVFPVWLLMQSALLRKFHGGRSPRTWKAALMHWVIGAFVLGLALSLHNPYEFLAVLVLVASVLPGLLTWWAAGPTS